MENGIWSKIKKIGSKILLITFVLAFVGFQAVFFNNGYTNKEFVEAQRQVQLLANLTLDKVNATTYKIEDQYDLQALQSFITQGGNTFNLTFLQTQDIALSGSGITIGTNSTSVFKGTYDGQNYSISNLNINASSYQAIGLFGWTNGATIQNVMIASGSVAASTDKTLYAGALVGNATNTKIYHCFNLGCSVTLNKGTTTIYAGGLVGKMVSTSTTNTARNDNYYVKVCYNSAVVTASNSGEPFAGGLVGYADRIYFQDSMNVGSVNATNSSTSNEKYAIAGGMVGQSSDCAFWSVVNGGSIFAQGYMKSRSVGSESSPEDVSSTLPITSHEIGYKIKTYYTINGYFSMAGGISGNIIDDSNYGTSVSFTNCINNGTISAPYLYAWGEASIISYHKNTDYAGVIDRFDFTGTETNPGMLVKQENAFQIGCNQAQADLSSCYYLAKTNNLNYQTKKSNVYRYFSLSGQVTNKLDTTLNFKDTSGYYLPSRTSPSVSFTNNSDPLSSRRSNPSSGDLSFTLTSGLAGDLLSDNNSLSIATLQWTLTDSMVALKVYYKGTYKYRKNILSKWTAKDFSTTSTVMNVLYTDYETAYNANCTGSIVIEKTQATIDKLGTAYWTMDPNINNGYPILKNFSWQGNIVKPGS